MNGIKFSSVGFGFVANAIKEEKAVVIDKLIFKGVGDGSTFEFDYIETLIDGERYRVFITWNPDTNTELGTVHLENMTQHVYEWAVSWKMLIPNLFKALSIH